MNLKAPGSKNICGSTPESPLMALRKFPGSNYDIFLHPQLEEASHKPHKLTTVF